MSLIYAPWTDEQVAALNRWQACDWVHPFTCGNRGDQDHEHTGGDILVATNAGWQCTSCDYTQNWAHDFMLKLPENPLSGMKEKE